MTIWAINVAAVIEISYNICIYLEGKWVHELALVTDVIAVALILIVGLHGSIPRYEEKKVNAFFDRGRKNKKRTILPRYS